MELTAVENELGRSKQDVVMAIATMTFDGGETETNCGQIDIESLQDFVVTALERHFDGYAAAAAAQEQYKRVKADIEANANLFGTAEAMRAGLAAHPEALEWAAFEQEATVGIEPYCFSIRFRTA
jgi:hypothetical protein